MDLLPIPPSSTNKVNSTSGTANDGGSKSQSGYIKVPKEQKNDSDKVDEVELSTKQEEDFEVSISVEFLLDDVKKLFINFMEFIKRIFKPRKKESIINPFKNSN